MISVTEVKEALPPRFVRALKTTAGLLAVLWGIATLNKVVTETSDELDAMNAQLDAVLAELAYPSKCQPALDLDVILGTDNAGDSEDTPQPQEDPA